MQKLIPWIASALVAVGSFFAGTSDIGESVQTVLDKDKAKAQCIALLEGDFPETVPAVTE